MVKVSILLDVLMRRFSQPEKMVLRRIERIRRLSCDRATPEGRWAARSSIAEPFGKYLFGLIRSYRPYRCLEIGTGMGISTSYLLAALSLNKRGILWSLDGDPSFQRLARGHMEGMSWKTRCHLICGKFEDTVHGALEEIGRIDFAFIDGGHREHAMGALCSKLLPFVSSGGGLWVFDDIRWSRGMWRWWRRFQGHPAVSHAVDFGQFGVVFLKGRR